MDRGIRLNVIYFLGAILYSVGALKISGGFSNQLQTLDLYVEPISVDEGKAACGTSPSVSAPCVRFVVPSPDQRGLVTVPRGSGPLNLRDISTNQLSFGQPLQAFTLYQYAWVCGSSACQYTEFDSTNPNHFVVYVTYILAKVYIDSPNMRFSCGQDVIIQDLKGTGASSGTGPITTTPQTFSFAGSATTINCVFGWLMMDADRSASSETFIRVNGNLPTINITIGPQSGYQMSYAIEVPVFIVVEEVNSPPTIAKCSSLYTDPPRTSILQNGLCLTSPASGYPDSESLSCSTKFFAPDKRVEYVCSSCGISKTTYYYIPEDSNATFDFLNFGFADQTAQGNVIITGIAVDITGGVISDPASSALISGISSSDHPWSFCAKSTTQNGCAISSDDALGNVFVPANINRYGLRVVKNTTFASLCVPSTQACSSSCDSGQPHYAGNGLCACTTNLCAALNGDNFVSASRVFYSNSAEFVASRLWIEFFDIDNATTVLERGYMDIQFATDTNEVTGTMIIMPSLMGAGDLGWQRISPLAVTGNFSKGRMNFQLATSDIQNVGVTVRSSSLLLSLPKQVSGLPDDFAIPDNSTKFLEGSLRSINLKLSDMFIASKTPPHFNTQIKNPLSRIYIDESFPAQTINPVEVSVGILYDPGVNDPPYGNLTTFEFPFTIMARNNPPTLSVPSNFTVPENQYGLINGIIVRDLDADEVLLTEFGDPPTGLCPVLPNQAVHLIEITLSSIFGSVYTVLQQGKLPGGPQSQVDTITVLTDQGVLITLNSVPYELAEQMLSPTGNVNCGFDNLPLCIVISAPDVAQMTGILQAQAITVYVGARSVTLRTPLSCAKLMFRNFGYRGGPDFNSDVVFPALADRWGCPATATGITSYSESITITVNDQGYTGCFASAPGIVTKSIPVHVSAVPQKNFILAMLQIAGLQDKPLSFSSFRCRGWQAQTSSWEVNSQCVSCSCGAVQMLVRDFGDKDILTRLYTMTLSVSHGSLTAVTNAAVQSITSGATNVRPFIMVVDGTICGLNQLLTEISYNPDQSFNTDYWTETSTNRWTKVSESLSVAITVQAQGPESNEGSSVVVPIYIQSVDQPMEPTLLTPDGIEIKATSVDGSSAPIYQKSPSLTVTNATADIYFCGGSVSCQTCPKSALACLELEKPDSFESRFPGQLCTISGNQCEMRITISASLSSIFLFGPGELDSVASVISGRRADLSTTPDIIPLLEASGNMLRQITVVQPVPWLQGSVLRLWPGSKYGPDLLNFTIDSGAAVTSFGIAMDVRTCANGKETVCLGWECAGSQSCKPIFDHTTDNTENLLMAFVGSGIVAFVSVFTLSGPCRSGVGHTLSFLAWVLRFRKQTKNKLKLKPRYEPPDPSRVEAIDRWGRIFFYDSQKWQIAGQSEELPKHVQEVEKKMLSAETLYVHWRAFQPPAPLEISPSGNGVDAENGRRNWGRSSAQQHQDASYGITQEEIVL